MENVTALFENVIKETYGDFGVSSSKNEQLQGWHDILKIAKKEFFKTEIIKHLKLKMECEELGDCMRQIKLENKRLIKKKETMSALERNNLYVWLTVNPNTSVELKDFLKQLHKFANRALFEEYMYVVEQRGTCEDTMGTGFHAHLLLKRSMTYKPGKVQKHSMNSWKRMTYVYNPQIFNFHWCPQKYIEDKKEYMRVGGKTGDGKELKQQIDSVWREKNNIQTFYESENNSI